MNESITENLKRVREKMDEACRLSSRPLSELRLVAVSKTKPIESIREAFEAGQTIFGENYVQEAVDKVNQMPEARWHFIGSLQTNKAKQVVGAFELIHSVDRLKLALALNSEAAARGRVQPILLQIHIGQESTKHGFSISEGEEALAQVAALPNLSVRGLMALPPIEDTEAKSRKNFSELRDALENWRPILPKDQRKMFKELSMGTSSDFRAAILEGATLVRVGTDIFGTRS